MTEIARYAPYRPPGQIEPIGTYVLAPIVPQIRRRVGTRPGRFNLY